MHATALSPALTLACSAPPPVMKPTHRNRDDDPTREIVAQARIARITGCQTATPKRGGTKGEAPTRQVTEAKARGSLLEHAHHAGHTHPAPPELLHLPWPAPLTASTKQATELPPEWAKNPKNQARWARLQLTTDFLRAEEAQRGALKCHYCGLTPLHIVSWDDYANQHHPNKATAGALEQQHTHAHAAQSGHEACCPAYHGGRSRRR